MRGNETKTRVKEWDTEGGGHGGVRNDCEESMWRQGAETTGHRAHRASIREGVWKQEQSQGYMQKTLKQTGDRTERKKGATAQRRFCLWAEWEVETWYFGWSQLYPWFKFRYRAFIHPLSLSVRHVVGVPSQRRRQMLPLTHVEPLEITGAVLCSHAHKWP